MFSFIMSHMGDILVLGVLALVVGGIIVKMIRDKKAGKSHCGCGCEGCANREFCSGVKPQ